MEETVLISVIVPVYNTAGFLPQCLDSIAENACRGLEILLIDDGSTDGSSLLLGRFCEACPAARVITQENRGLSAARNTGLDAARGEWILFIDSDDYVLPGFFGLPLEKASETGADLVLFGFRELMDETGYTIPRADRLPEGVFSARDILRALARSEVFPNAWNKLYRRSLWDGIRFPEGECWEDCAVMHRVISRADRILILHDALYCYRLRKNSITKNAENDLSVYFWRYLQYGKRYAFLLERFPDLAVLMDPVREESALKYCAALSVGEDRDLFLEMRQNILQGHGASGVPIPASRNSAASIRFSRILLRLSPRLFRWLSGRLLARKRQDSPWTDGGRARPVPDLPAGKEAQP